MGNSRDYVWEQMLRAILCMCSEGDLETGLCGATISGPMHLRDDDLKDSDLFEDLTYVLSWTKHNIEGGKMKKLPDEVELSKLNDKMMHILLETHEKGC